MKDNFYTYCNLKYKHSPFLDESITIGVLVYFGASQRFIFKYSKNLSRIKNIYNNVPEKTIKECLKQIDNLLVRYYSVDENIFPFNDTNLKEFLTSTILPTGASVLQFSNFRTETLEHEEKLIEKILLSQYFIEDIKTTINPSKDPIVLDHLISDLNKAGFSQYSKSNRIQRNWEIPTKNGKFNFDFAWKNGVWNLVKPVSFDLTTPDRIISKARNNLGEFTDLYSELDSTEFKGNIVVGRPKSKFLYPSYDKAIKILEKSKARIVEEADQKAYSKYKQDILEAVSKKDT